MLIIKLDCIRCKIASEHGFDSTNRAAMFLKEIFIDKYLCKDCEDKKREVERGLREAKELAMANFFMGK